METLLDEEQLKNIDKFVLYFSAKWCKNCPEFEKNIQYKFGYKYYKVDIDKHPDLVVDYEIEKIPCLKYKTTFRKSCFIF